MEVEKNDVYIVRYGFNDGAGVCCKVFNSEFEAYDFYRGLEGFALYSIISSISFLFFSMFNISKIFSSLFSPYHECV